MPLNTASWSVIPGRLPGPKLPRECRVLHEVGATDLVPKLSRTLIRTVSWRSPSMMSSAPRPVMESLPGPPSRMSPAPKTGPVTGQKPAAEFAMTVAALSVRGCGTIAFSPAMRFTPAWSSTSQPVKPAPPTEFGAVSVPLMMSSNGRAGIGLGLLPAVAVDDHLDRQADEVVVDFHVVVGSDGVVLVEGPVEAACAGVAVDGRVLGHQVVATLGVVVVLARLTDEDVVAGSDLRRIVEERRTVIALQEILTGSAFDPVVATVAEHGVGALTGDDEVIARAGEGSRCRWRRRS